VEDTLNQSRKVSLNFVIFGLTKDLERCAERASPVAGRGLAAAESTVSAQRRQGCVVLSAS